MSSFINYRLGTAKAASIIVIRQLKINTHENNEAAITELTHYRPAIPYEGAESTRGRRKISRFYNYLSVYLSIY